MVFDDLGEFDDPQVSDVLKVTSNESMDFNDSKSLMIQREFQLEVWSLIIHKYGRSGPRGPNHVEPPKLPTINP